MYLVTTNYMIVVVSRRKNLEGSIGAYHHN